ncbi:MAG: inosine/xanthosine triphosphatase [Mariniblastus sp.]|jgi:inosine/xanthosine triphosphatase
MDKKTRIAVGSRNPVKIQAAQAGFEAVFPTQVFEATGFSVPSGVCDQPMSNQETLQGASHRAHTLREQQPDFDYYVGIEGGLETIDSTLFASAWMVIVDAQGNTSSGKSGSFAIPPKIKQLIESGIELGHANDQFFLEHNSKQRGGAVGSLTNGLISRQVLYEHAMILALIGMLQKEMFSLA